MSKRSRKKKKLKKSNRTIKSRKTKKSSLMMKFNNKVIKKMKLMSFLVCKKDLINFYSKFGWIKIKKKNFETSGFSASPNGMLYNCGKMKLDRIKLNFLLNDFQKNI